MSRAKMFMAAMVGVLALSAVASSLASAATAGWMVKGAQLTTTKALATTAAVDKKGVLKASQVEVTCVSSVLGGTNPLINGVAENGSATSLIFKECSGNAVCPLEQTEVGTLPVVVDLTLDGTTAVKGRFLPTNTSKLFATLKFGGAECSFSGVQGVTGAATVLAPTGQEERTLQQLNATNEEAGSLKLASSSATLEGAILVRLASGEPFSFL